MAKSKFNNSAGHSPRLLCLLTISFFFLTLPHSSSLSFDITTFGPKDEKMNYSGNATVGNGVIYLTESQRDQWMNSSMGRAIYAEKLQLWDKSSRNLTDFKTNFTFSINSQNSSNYGDGIAFFLAPSDFPLPNMTGGGLGLARENETSLVPFVSVEFDTYPNPWDPVRSPHVGIDINSTVSKAYSKWSDVNVMRGKKNSASISYNSASKNLSVTFTEFDRDTNGTTHNHLSYIVDLRDYLPESVTIGFASATGMSSEIHTLYSWSFISNLKINDHPITSVDPPSTNKGVDIGFVVGLTVGGFSVLMGLVSLFLLKRNRGKKDDEQLDEIDLTMDNDFQKGSGPRRFSYNDLVRATNNFSEKEQLGEGGFGAVYRGFLKDLGCYVAVKRVSRGSKQGIKEYASEVTIISRLRHRNLVQLIGWCHQRKELLIVYDFMSNGSLDSHLFRDDILLTWKYRYHIAQGLASGLFYLQEEWELCVVHRDIKSSNVMLDLNFNAKLGDFGLATLVDHGNALKTMTLAGTIGYMAPEYLYTGKASKESDIYSFGIVLLEICCGRKAIEDQVNLRQWVWDLYNKGETVKAVDPRLNGDFDENQVECLMVVGLWCAHPEAMCRPSIKQAIQVLNFEATLPELPGLPTFSWVASTSSISDTTHSVATQNKSSSFTNSSNSSQVTTFSVEPASALLLHAR